MSLETTDGCGLLAYAGLGATTRGTQPSEWMSAVLRGHGGLRFEQALGVLSAAANEQLPKHLPYIRDPNSRAHFILVPAFIRGVGSRLYSIDNVLDPKTKEHRYRYTSHQKDLPGLPSARLACTGTGGFYLARTCRTWERELLSLVKAHDRGKITDKVIADYLAKLNYEAHRKLSDGSVGPRCIVIWRRRPDGRKTVLGNGQRSYTGIVEEQESPSIPAIANGMDMHALVGVLIDQIRASIEDGEFNPQSSPFANLDMGEINRLVENLPYTPDEKLR